MFTLLLVVIYISFISLGLPDAMLGSAWPSMYQSLNASISYAGIVSMIIAGGTIVSSLLSDKLIKKLGTGLVTLLSVAMTALALFGFSVSGSFALLCLWAIPYGLGAGSVDAALNNFVALHYKARHMSWLHCFWGIGASLGPYIMGYCLTGNRGWHSGYRVIFFIQVCLTAMLFLSLPLWKKSTDTQAAEEKNTKSLTIRELLATSGAKPAVAAFFFYCSLETTTGLWGSSYMVLARGIPADVAAKWISIFYLGITAGRFLCGFLTMKISGENMVRLGQAAAAIGVLVLLLPLPSGALSVGFVLIGMGCAPIYPSLLHATPEHFGKDASQAFMGLQMACAYIGTTFMPPLVGLVVERVDMRLYPYFLLVFVGLMLLMAEKLNKAPKYQA